MDLSTNFADLDKLEKKITNTVKKLEELRSENSSLRVEKDGLETEIEELKQRNIELSKKINDLHIKEEKYASSFNREEVRRKIDHMLEKFGELQL